MNYLSFSIIIFMMVFLIIQFLKPSIIYNSDGSLRQFGIGYRKKTVVPLWLVVILLAIFSYTFSLYFTP
jgi:hypothetical protein